MLASVKKPKFEFDEMSCILSESFDEQENIDFVVNLKKLLKLKEKEKETENKRKRKLDEHQNRLVNPEKKQFGRNMENKQSLSSGDSEIEHDTKKKELMENCSIRKILALDSNKGKIIKKQKLQDEEVARDYKEDPITQEIVEAFAEIGEVNFI